MKYNLPKITSSTRKISIYFLISLFFGICYFIFIKIPQQNSINEEIKRKEESLKEQSKIFQSAIFAPPKDLYQEIEIKGFVEKLNESDKFQGLDKKATHKIVDGNSKILYFAYSTDDKLYQQEGFEVTVGAKTNYGAKPYTKTLIEVVYIAIK